MIEMNIIRKTVTVELNDEQWLMTNNQATELAKLVREYNRVYTLRENAFRDTALEALQRNIDITLENCMELIGPQLVTFSCDESVIDEVMRLTSGVAVQEVRRG